MWHINMHNFAERRLFSAGVVRIAVAVALSFHLSVSHANALDSSMHIALGRQGAEIVKQSPVPVKQSEIGGSRIYDAGWYTSPIDTTVVLDDADHPVVFPVVAKGVTFYELIAAGGVDDVSLDFRLPQLTEDPVFSATMADHDEVVRKIVQETIDRINQAGWKRKIESDRPTFWGRASIAFMRSYRDVGNAMVQHSASDIDPSYRMTPEDWSNLAGGSTTHLWNWTKNGASMTLGYSRAKGYLGGIWQSFEKLRVDIVSDDATSFKVFDFRTPPDKEL